MLSGALGEYALGEITGVDAIAAGALLQADVELIPGAAAGNAVAAGAMLEFTLSALGGAAYGDASAGDAILVTDVSLAGGAAYGDANVPGGQITADLSLLPGEATGGSAGDATAPGAVVATTFSLVPGSASGTRPQHSGGISFPAPRRRPSTITHVDVVAFGDVVTARFGILAGRARGDAAAPGAIVSMSTEASAGDAGVAVEARGAELVALFGVEPGTAKGQRRKIMREPRPIRRDGEARGSVIEFRLHLQNRQAARARRPHDDEILMIAMGG